MSGLVMTSNSKPSLTVHTLLSIFVDALCSHPVEYLCGCLGYGGEQAEVKLLVFSQCLKAASSGPTWCEVVL